MAISHENSAAYCFSDGKRRLQAGLSVLGVNDGSPK